MFRSFKDYMQAQSLTGGCAIAVSGGGDSVALLRLFIELGYKPLVLHYHHGLRKESDYEAAFVKKLAEDYDCPYEIGYWDATTDGANIQQSARNARYHFFEEMLTQYKIKDLFVAHTEDDLLETLFLRMSKGSGVSGLPGLSQFVSKKTYNIHRPLLSVSRKQLREYLTSIEQGWCDDPTNENETYWRPRFRKHKKALEDLGLTPVSLKGFIDSVVQVNDFIDQELHDFVNNYVTTRSESSFEVDALLLAQKHPEIRHRVYNYICRKLMAHKGLRKSTKQELDKLLTRGGKISIGQGFAEVKKAKLIIYINLSA